VSVNKACFYHRTCSKGMRCWVKVTDFHFALHGADWLESVA